MTGKFVIRRILNDGLCKCFDNEDLDLNFIQILHADAEHLVYYVSQYRQNSNMLSIRQFSCLAPLRSPSHAKPLPHCESFEDAVGFDYVQVMSSNSEGTTDVAPTALIRRSSSSSSGRQRGKAGQAKVSRICKPQLLMNTIQWPRCYNLLMHSTNGCALFASPVAEELYKIALRYHVTLGITRKTVFKDKQRRRVVSTECSKDDYRNYSRSADCLGCWRPIMGGECCQASRRRTFHTENRCQEWSESTFLGTEERAALS